MGNFKHGMSNTRVYRIWGGMKDRCKNDRQGYWGKRGIRVCERWINSFEAFYRDMGNPPSSIYSIDRINVNGHYEPDNCRWATRTEQARNTTQNTILSFNGESMTLAEWAEKTRIKSATICLRLARGWSVAHTLTKPVQPIRIGKPWEAVKMSRSSWYRMRHKQ